VDKVLHSILKPFDRWENNEGEARNNEAKEALVIFYRELSKRKPTKKYCLSNSLRLHLNYIPYFVKLKRAFDQRLYMRVCNEIISLMHYDDIFQRRIYYNTLKLIEEYLEVGEDIYGIRKNN